MQLGGQEQAIGCILVAIDDPNKGLLASGNFIICNSFIMLGRDENGVNMYCPCRGGN